MPGPARRALIVHGCDAATSRTQIAQIARRTGVSVGTVYHHFPDKRDILLELIDQWSDSLPYQRRMALDIEPRAATRQILRRLFEQMKKGGSLHRLILTESMHDSVLRRHYERAQRAVVESMCDLIEMGRTRGLVRPERRPATTAFLLHHAIDMTLGLAEHSASDAEAERLLDEAADLICNYVFLEDQLE